MWHNDAMSNSAEVTSKSRLHSVAVVFASLIIAAPIVASLTVKAIMDSSNPAGLEDVTVPLAYLSEILVVSFTVLGTVVLAFIISTVTLYLRERTITAISLPLTVGIIQFFLGAVALVLNGVVSGAGG